MFTLGYDSIDEFLLRVHIQLAIDGAYVGFHRIGRHGEFFADGTPRLPLSKQQHHLGLSLRHRTLGSHEPHDRNSAQANRKHAAKLARIAASP